MGGCVNCMWRIIHCGFNNTLGSRGELDMPIRQRDKVFRFAGCIKIKIHRTIILPIVLYGCETWSLILREERKLRVRTWC